MTNLHQVKKGVARNIVKELVNSKCWLRNMCIAGGVVLAAAALAMAQGDAEPGRGEYIGGAPVELSPEEAARQLANPNTPLATLTLKSQWTRWGGDLPGAAGMNSGTFLFQPSFPFKLSKTDSIFLRPAFPLVVNQPVVDSSGHVGTASGFGDMGMDFAYGRTTQTGFLFAVGVLAGFPIGTGKLSSDTWTMGPEMLLGKISKQSVLGVFPSHQWDLSGPKETSLTSVQPIIVFLPGGGWAVGTNGPITFNWVADQWTIPLQLSISKTLKIGKQPIKMGLEISYYIEKADALGQEWMISLNIAPVVRNVFANWVGAD